jgi:hypothetical protein
MVLHPLILWRIAVSVGAILPFLAMEEKFSHYNSLRIQLKIKTETIDQHNGINLSPFYALRLTRSITHLRWFQSDCQLPWLRP